MYRSTALVLPVALFCGIVLLGANSAQAQTGFVNWENPHVHPLDLTPDGTRLLAVHTADNRLLVFDITSGTPVQTHAIAVGLDPVSVRARSDDHAWVVNHVSDSVSIVDLAAGNVVATLQTADEPADVVFAGTPQRAFVSCSQANEVMVFDPDDLTLAPVTLDIDAEDPRSMAVSPDGDTVYVAVFESGNGTTVLGGGSTIGGGFPPNVVNDPGGPYGGTNPPPNDGLDFEPPQDGGNPPPPAVGLIVRKDAGGTWLDDNGGDWSAVVSGADAADSGRPPGWDVPDHDVALIDATGLQVTYANRLMNICMAIAVNPATGDITVVGTEATNEIRYEPNLNGRFIRVNFAAVDAADPGLISVVDLNPHLTYATSTVAQVTRDESLGDPRGLVWNAAGARGYVTGMGSNNVVVLDAAGNRSGAQPTIEVGQGPTGIVLDEPRQRLYVMNKFEAAISVVDTVTEEELARVPFFDPTPQSIKVGRKHLYDTHETSGLGHTACASCHLDARMDRLAWDLGDPAGGVKSFDQNCNNGVAGGCPDWHPMKGPMTTQTLQDIIGKEPHHWRGDRSGLEEFNGAFESLLGDDEQLSAEEMQEYEDFLATITFPPNPFRNMDNSLPTQLVLEGHFTTGRFAPAGQPLGIGNAVNGLNLHRTAGLDGVNCVSCHTLPTGIGSNYALNGAQFVPVAPGPNGELHHAIVTVDGSTNINMKTPHLRNLYEKVGFETTQVSNRAGFGFLHDGSVDSIARFVSEPVFSVSSDQEVADLVAFMLAFSGSDLPLGSPTNPGELPGPLGQDSHAAVGMQTTLVEAATAPAAQLQLIADLLSLADGGAVGVVVKGLQADEVRGYTYLGGDLYQSDRVAETITAAKLQAAAAPGSELTWTVVPAGTELRIGIDRDVDGHFDRDEIDGCSDPADPLSVPPQCTTECTTVADCADLDGNGIRDDGCVFWSCADGTCMGTAVAYADLGGEFGGCMPDGTTDGNDRFHALNCFSNQSTAGTTVYPCEADPPAAFNVDAAALGDPCSPDGVCDGNDAFAALNAFAGTTSCGCDGGPGPQSPSTEHADEKVSEFNLDTSSDESNSDTLPESAAIVLEPSSDSVAAGGLVEVDVLLANSLPDLRGYQLHLSVHGGNSGHLELVDIAIRSPDAAAPPAQGRLQHVYAGLPFWAAFNADTAQMVAGLDEPGVGVSSGYLATFLYRVSSDASGTFTVELLHDPAISTHRTVLFPTPVRGRIVIEAVRPAGIGVQGLPRRTRSARN